MKVYVCIVVLIANIISSYGQIEHPNYPGKCWVRSQGIAVSPGEHWYEDCTEFTCEEGPSYRAKACPLQRAGPECTHIDYNYNLPYPRCCPHYECP